MVDPVPVVSAQVQIEWLPNSDIWTDLSSRVVSLTIKRPRYSPQSGASTTELEVQLLNNPDPGTAYCPLSPDSPLSPYYPNITRDRQIRVTAVWASGASTSLRFYGWTDVWVPDSGENPPATATVTLTASCVLSRYARRQVLSVFGESVIQVATNDYYPFDDAADAESLRVIPGSSTAGVPSDGLMIQPSRYPGGATLSSPDGGHLTDGQIDFTRGDNNAPSPVVLIPLRDPAALTINSLTAWYRLSDDPAGAAGDDILSGYDAGGNRLWVWGPRIVAGAVVWSLYDNTGTLRSFYNTGSPRDDGWHYWMVQFPSATTSAIFLANKGESSTSASAGSSAWPYDPRQVKYLVVGGQMNPKTLGKQTNTFQGSISSLLLQYSSTVSYLTRGNPGVSVPASTVNSQLSAITLSIDTIVGGAFGTPSDSTPTRVTNSTTDVLERRNELARTVSGALITRPEGKRYNVGASLLHPLTVTASYDAEAHLSAPDGGWQQTKDEKPTRVTVTSPLGTVELIDTATETLTGLRLEGGSIDTSAGTRPVMESVGQSILAAGSARISSFGIDLSTVPSKITETMALDQIRRVRVTNLPAALMGVTYVDVYAVAWTETYNADTTAYVFQFDTDPADDPSEDTFDNAEYGRFADGDGAATVTGGTALAGTGTGTLIVTTTSPFTTTGGDYTVDLDWNGERVTASAVGGGISPQTFTITARGVAPSVARTHTAGEPIDIWHAARFGA